MNTSDDKKLFQDMQQHPEKYSDEQIEAMMSQIDQEPNVEAAWENFCAKNATPKAKHSFAVWYKSAAAIVIIVLGLWGVKLATASHQQDSLLAEESTTQQSEIANDDNETALISDKTDSTEEKLLAQVTAQESPVSETAEDIKTVKEENTIHIRGNNITPDNQPLYIINGKKLQGQHLLDLFNPDDIAEIKVYKDDEKIAEYSALYGEEAKNGIIVITLKEGSELAYADILGLDNNQQDVLAVAEVLPAFSGGEKAYQTFIKENLNTSAEIEESGVAGKIIISFMVDKEGNHRDYQLSRSLLKNPDKSDCEDSTIINACTEEAIRVCRLMPQWTPGQQATKDGMKPVDVKMFMPFSFGKKEIRIR